MNRRTTSRAALSVCLVTCLASPSWAIGLRGGGGAGAFRGGGGAGFSGGGISRPSTPNLGGMRPSPNFNYPSINRPSPSFNQPAFNRPSYNRPSYTRPSVNQPSFPSGGLKPSTRPSPGSSGNFGGTGGFNRPGTGSNLSDRFPQRPGSSSPSLGGFRPGGSTGATTLPARPGFGTRPDLGASGRPSTLPSRPTPGSRPSLPGGSRPSPGDLGDFLGMQKPIGRPETRPAPGTGTRPGFGTDRPGFGTDRPGLGTNRPGTSDRFPGISGNRPVAGGSRPEFGSRPDWLSRQRPDQNTRISTRPSWANIDNSTNINIHNRWNTALTRPANNNWWNRPSNRLNYWNGWGDGVRNHWGYYHQCHRWYGPNWWYRYPGAITGWHYHWRWGAYTPGYWWMAPTWTGLTSWFVWPTTSVVWQQPIYYDYGTGGNVVYQDNSVYIGGQQVASADEFAQSAATLATVAPPATQEEAESADWMALGTFIVTSGEQDVNPGRTVQLAVNRQGIIGGTLYNAETDQAQVVQGRVDPETQRVAFRVGDNESVVVETGLYNLTQDEVPLLVHFGTERVENWLLVRLKEQDSAETP